MSTIFEEFSVEIDKQLQGQLKKIQIMSVPPLIIPYGKQLIEQDDVDVAAKATLDNYLTTGPAVTQFEEAFAAAVCNGTYSLRLVNGDGINTQGTHCLCQALLENE